MNRMQRPEVIPVSAMDTPTVPGDGAGRLAEGLAAQVEAWARARGATDEDARAARRAARALSLAMAEGHVCLPLEPGGQEPSQDAASLQDSAALLRSGVVGTPRHPGAMPLVLDEEGRLYLHRYFDYECRLARRLRMAAVAATPPSPTAIEWLNRLFEPSGPEVDWQKLAAALALRQRLAVISGGPGTGKTTTVVNLLACLIAQQPDCRIALAAPTGKAAARLVEALRLRAAHLPDEIRERLPAQASTVHRLLGVRGDGRFLHGPDRPLPIDALIVDEASMLDLALATRLLEAVPAGARIVLLGDKDQLSAVEAGAVFAELSADPHLSDTCRADLAAWCGLPVDAVQPPAAPARSPLADTSVWFTRNFRFRGDSGIGRLAREINAGRSGEAVEWLRRGEDPTVRWLDDSTPELAAQSMERLIQGYSGYFDTVLRNPADVAAITAAFGRYRVLCAQRSGARGVDRLNDRIETELRQRLARAGLAGDPRSSWFIGRPVMVLRNDHVMRLYNGDVGIVLPGPDGALAVHFPLPDGRFRALPPVRLPAHDSAFAMTVHKSQGSEFDEVFIVLPAQPHRLLSRELLYTAVTRAKSAASLCAPASVMAAAIGSPTRRNSGLRARLLEAGTQGPT